MKLQYMYMVLKQRRSVKCGMNETNPTSYAVIGLTLFYVTVKQLRLFLWQTVGEEPGQKHGLGKNIPFGDQQTLKDPVFSIVLSEKECVRMCVWESQSVSEHSVPPQARLTGQITVYLQSAGSAHSASLISRRQAASSPMKVRRRELKGVFVLLCHCLFSIYYAELIYSRLLCAEAPPAASV